VSWFPTLRAMWSPKGQQIMIRTPGQPKKHYGIGAVNYHTGETVVIFRKHKRRREMAELLQMLVDKHSTGTSMWRGITHPPTKMMKSRQSVRAAADAWSCCICQLTALAQPD